MRTADLEARRFNEEVGRLIERARRARELTGTELARRAGISQPGLCFFESGERGCRPHILARLAEALGIPVAELLPEFTNCKYPKKARQRL